MERTVWRELKMRTKKKRSVDFTTKMNETKMCSNFVEHSKYTNDGTKEKYRKEEAGSRLAELAIQHPLW